MTPVKDRPIDKTVRRRFDPAIVTGQKLERQEREPEYWRARREKKCKGCGRRFMPQARADLYCKPCSEAGKGWAGRKDKRPEETGESPAEVRQTGYPWDENVLVESRGSARRFKPYGDCTVADCEAVAARQRGNAKNVIGETRRFALHEAARFSELAGVMRSCGAGTVAELAAVGANEGRRAA